MPLFNNKYFETAASNLGMVPNFVAHTSQSFVMTSTGSAEVISVEFHNFSPSPSWVKLFYVATASLASNSGSYERFSETIPSGSTVEYKRMFPLKNGEGFIVQAQQTASIAVSTIFRSE